MYIVSSNMTGVPIQGCATVYIKSMIRQLRSMMEMYIRILAEIADS